MSLHHPMQGLRQLFFYVRIGIRQHERPQRLFTGKFHLRRVFRISGLQTITVKHRRFVVFVDELKLQELANGIVAKVRNYRDVKMSPRREVSESSEQIVEHSIVLCNLSYLEWASCLQPLVLCVIQVNLH
jgi:hypothetical protein